MGTTLLLMRILATLLLLIPVLCFGQNCLYNKNEIDEFTNEVKKITRPTAIGNNLIATFMRIDTSKYLGVTMRVDIGCLVPGKSYIIIKYQSGSTRKLLHQGEIECGEGVSFLTTLNSELISEFKRNELVKIRVSYESYKDITIYDTRTFSFMEGVICID